MKQAGLHRAGRRGPPCARCCCLAPCPVREERRPWLVALPRLGSCDGNTSEPWHDAAGARDTQVARLRALERVRTTKNWCSVGKESGKKANTPVLIEIQSQSSEIGKHSWKSREASALLPSFCFSLNFCLGSAGRSGGCGQSPRTGWGPRSVKPWLDGGGGGSLLAQPLEWWLVCSCPSLPETRGACMGPIFILKAP